MADNRKHTHRGHHHLHLFYPERLLARIYSIVLAPLIMLIIAFTTLYLLGGFLGTSSSISAFTIIAAISATFLRLLAAYILALIVSLPLAFLAHKSPRFEKVLLPVFDILQSVPVLAFFPVIVLLFVRFNFLNGAAILILFLAMVWNIVFSLVGGLKVVPNEVTDAAKVFGVQGWAYYSKVALPSIVPYLVTGSLLAWAQGWNIVIVAEVLHTYIVGGTPAQDLFGIGNVLVTSIASGQTEVFMCALLGMVAGIATLNFLVWQKLLRFSERFRFE